MKVNLRCSPEEDFIRYTTFSSLQKTNYTKLHSRESLKLQILVIKKARFRFRRSGASSFKWNKNVLFICDICALEEEQLMNISQPEVNF